MVTKMAVDAHSRGLDRTSLMVWRVKSSKAGRVLEVGVTVVVPLRLDEAHRRKRAGLGLALERLVPPLMLLRSDDCPAAAPLLPPTGRNGGFVIAGLIPLEFGGVVRLEGIEPPALRSGAARSVR